MSRQIENKTPSSCITFTVPDFVDAGGISYTNIEVIVELDGDIRDAANLAGSLDRSMKVTHGR
jgi:hypothetical protein